METKAQVKYLAEALGTMILVLIGCGSAVLGGQYIAIALTFGLTVVALSYSLGPISGCVLNPAITVGLMIAKRMSTKEGMMYILMQFIGAIVGAGLLYLIASGKTGYSLTQGLGQNGYDTASPGGYTMASGFITEVLLMMVFVLAVLGATSKAANSGYAGIAIGFTLITLILMGFPVTGVGINPARSFGPALFVGGVALEQVWLFIVAPILGAMVAAVIWKSVLGRD
jgi:aquaporin Z